jgi:uncharacterized protein
LLPIQLFWPIYQINSMKKAFFLLLAFAGAPVWVQAQTVGPDYVAKLERDRASKDSSFRVGAPLSPEQRQKFTGLAYYDINPALKVTAQVTPLADGKVLKMKTSTSRVAQYREYAELTFELDGQKYTLVVYADVVPNKNPAYRNHLFLPFYDQTSGRETYGGGRYLDLTRPLGDTVELDFNLAYNPYCAYTDGYSCPLPPRRNKLPVAVLAGEKYTEKID